MRLARRHCRTRSRLRSNARKSPMTAVSSRVMSRSTFDRRGPTTSAASTSSSRSAPSGSRAELRLGKSGVTNFMARLSKPSGRAASGLLVAACHRLVAGRADAELAGRPHLDVRIAAPRPIRTCRK